MEKPRILVPVTYEVGPLFGDREKPIQSIYEESSTQKYALGTPLEYNDGRKFRYAKNGGTALVKALMTTAEDQYSYVEDETQSTFYADAAVGAYEIRVDVTTGGSYVENEFAQGFLTVVDVTGEGDIYKILANKIDASDDTLMRVLLETPIRTAFGATTQICLSKNRWRDVDVFPTTAVCTPAGVPLIAVTANYYCWLQTKGYCPMKVDTDDTIVKGEPAGKPGTNAVAGAVGLVANDGTDIVYGYVVWESAHGDTAIIDLKID